MKKISISTLTVVVLSFVLTAAAQDRVLTRAYIPFSFDVQGQSFKAGRYELHEVMRPFVRLENVDTGRSVGLIGRQSMAASDVPTLTFHKYGNRYFLATVGAPSYQIYLPKSKSEMEAEGSGFNLKTTTVAAQIKH